LLFLFVLDLIQQFFDAHSFFDGLVVIEGELRNASHVVQTLAQRTADETPGGPETFEALFTLVLIAENRDENPAMPQIRRHFDGGNRGEPDPGVMDLTLDNFAELDSKLFFYPVDSSSLHVCSHDFDIALNRALRCDSFGFLSSLFQDLFQEL